jgi:hypothetical protein
MNAVTFQKNKTAFYENPSMNPETGKKVFFGKGPYNALVIKYGDPYENNTANIKTAKKGSNLKISSPKKTQVREEIQSPNNITQNPKQFQRGPKSPINQFQRVPQRPTITNRVQQSPTIINQFQRGPQNKSIPTIAQTADRLNNVLFQPSIKSRIPTINNRNLYYDTHNFYGEAQPNNYSDEQKNNHYSDEDINNNYSDEEINNNYSDDEKNNNEDINDIYNAYELTGIRDVDINILENISDIDTLNALYDTSQYTRSLLNDKTIFNNIRLNFPDIFDLIDKKGQHDMDEGFVDIEKYSDFIRVLGEFSKINNEMKIDTSNKNAKKKYINDFREGDRVIVFDKFTKPKLSHWDQDESPIYQNYTIINTKGKNITLQKVDILGKKYPETVTATLKSKKFSALTGHGTVSEWKKYWYVEDKKIVHPGMVNNLGVVMTWDGKRIKLYEGGMSIEIRG